MGLTGNRALALTADPEAPTCGERLLLAAIRSWALARRRGEAPQAVVRPALSEAASERIGALFTAWMESIETAAARPVEIRCLCSSSASQDERRLLAACAVAAVTLDLARSLLRPLLRDAEAASVLARALNGAFAAEGWALPARLLDAPAAPCAVPSATLH